MKRQCSKRIDGVDMAERDKWIHHISETMRMWLRKPANEEQATRDEEGLRYIACRYERQVYCKAKSFEQYKCKIRAKLTELCIIKQTQLRCVVCMGRNSTHIVVPCGHHCICAQCSSNIKARQQSCPICRQTIDSIIKVYAA